MRSYRCYFLNQANLIAAVEIVEAEADEDALIRAARLLDGKPHYRAIEVWDCARRVFPRARDKCCGALQVSGGQGIAITA